jgi:GNAT superfamily N-acetyltransferase
MNLVCLDSEREQELLSFCAETFPAEPFTLEIVRRRLLSDPDFTPELALGAYRNDRLAALAVAAPRERQEGFAGCLKWFGVHPAWRRQGLGGRLLAELEQRLRAHGCYKIETLGSSPCHLAPGVSTRHTELISFLLRHGYLRTRTCTNMETSLDDRSFEATQLEERLTAESKIRIARLTPEDERDLNIYMGMEWSDSWRVEANFAYLNDPVSCFIARQGDGHLCGFAAYDVNQFAGSFGPTGVSVGTRGLGVGRALFLRCLTDMQERGYPQAVIGNVGPVDFYHRAVGAQIGEIFWLLEKRF